MIRFALIGWASVSPACSESEPEQGGDGVTVSAQVASAGEGARAASRAGGSSEVGGSAASSSQAGAGASSAAGGAGDSSARGPAPSQAGADASSSAGASGAGAETSGASGAGADAGGANRAGTDAGGASGAGAETSGASGAGAHAGGANRAGTDGGGASGAGAGGPNGAGGAGMETSGASGAGGAGAQTSGAGGTGAAGTVPAAGQGGAMTPSTWRIAFLGDSITETSCTSQLVYAALRAQGHTNFDLVGTKQNQQGCGVDDPDRDVEGHSGYLVTNLVGSGANAAELPMWCAADRADLVLMHFGTNDAWNSGIPIMDIVSAYSGVLAALRAVQPRVIVFVAQIIPLSPDNCADCERRVRELNALIPTWAASESSADSPIHVVDQWTGFDPSTHAYDRVHPNMLGSKKMADVWMAALRAQKIF